MAFIVLFLVLRATSFIDSWRGTFLLAALAWGLLVTAFTEGLSFFHILDRGLLAILWGASILTGALYLILSKRKLTRVIAVPRLPKLSRFERTYVIGAILIVSVIGVCAWFAPPNTWDSMTYHLSRVVHWIQNNNVEHYTTHILRQLYLNPWAEFAILQFQILSGGDQFANLIQWFSMIGSAICVSLITRQFGAAMRGQIISAIIALTIPMGILQGSSTQNDYVAAFWLVCFVYFFIILKSDQKPVFALITGTALGLALLTKATAYLFALPFLLWIAFSIIRSKSTHSIKLLSIIAGMALLINLGFYVRNYRLFGNSIAPDPSITQEKVQNETLAPLFILSNVVRNISLHLGTNPSLSKMVEDGIYGLHNILGIDANDARTTWQGTEFHVPPIVFQEDNAGNPFHILLVFFGIAAFVSFREKDNDLTYYLVCLASGFVLFCLYLKWQPWNSRLHLPLFILCAPWLGYVLSKFSAQSIVNAVVFSLVLVTFPWLLFNQDRPLLAVNSVLWEERDQQYFKRRPEIKDAYIGTAEFLRDFDCKDIGLIVGRDDSEYPLWVLLGDRHGPPIRIEHVNVENISNSLINQSSFTACAVIVVGDEIDKEIRIGITNYSIKISTPPISVYTKTPNR